MLLWLWTCWVWNDHGMFKQRRLENNSEHGFGNRRVLRWEAQLWSNRGSHETRKLFTRGKKVATLIEHWIWRVSAGKSPEERKSLKSYLWCHIVSGRREFKEQGVVISTKGYKEFKRKKEEKYQIFLNLTSSLWKSNKCR